jgi:hypothetical protein
MCGFSDLVWTDVEGIQLAEGGGVAIRTFQPRLPSYPAFPLNANAPSADPRIIRVFASAALSEFRSVHFSSTWDIYITPRQSCDIFCSVQSPSEVTASMHGIALNPDDSFSQIIDSLTSVRGIPSESTNVPYSFARPGKAPWAGVRFSADLVSGKIRVYGLRPYVYGPLCTWYMEPAKLAQAKPVIFMCAPQTVRIRHVEEGEEQYPTMNAMESGFRLGRAFALARFPFI